MKKIKMEIIVFAVGSILQAASFGYFLGGLQARVGALEKDMADIKTYLVYKQASR